MFYDFSKRFIDIVLSTIAFVIFLPIAVLVAIGIKLTSQGPIFYRPQRVGRGGDLFKMLKFRSMHMYDVNGKKVHAENYLTMNPKLMKKYQLGSYKLTDDPRITSFGKIIRKYSLDELPQILNVLKGDMSLVGPRAYQNDELIHQQRVYPHTKKFVKLILRVRPGASGPWQVSGRSFINFDKRVEMDAMYIKRRSTIYDLFIIGKTPFAMINAKGAV